MIIGSACHADSSLLIGEWQCKFEAKDAYSEYSVDGELTVNRDTTYRLLAKTSGPGLVDIGTWDLNGDELVLHREFHIASGIKEPSKRTTTHSIITLNNNNLAFTKGKGTLTCVK